MLNAKRQAEEYARALPTPHGWPPFILVCDVGRRTQGSREYLETVKKYPNPPAPNITQWWGLAGLPGQKNGAMTATATTTTRNSSSADCSSQAMAGTPTPIRPPTRQMRHAII